MAFHGLRSQVEYEVRKFITTPSGEKYPLPEGANPDAFESLKVTEETVPVE